MKFKLRQVHPVRWNPGAGYDVVTFMVRPAATLAALEFKERLDGLGPTLGGDLAEKPGDGPELLAVKRKAQRERIEMMLAHAVPAVIAWEGVAGDDDRPAECSQEAVRALLGEHMDALAIVFGATFGRSVAVDPDRPNESGAGYVAALPGPTSPAASTSVMVDSVEVATT